MATYIISTMCRNNVYACMIHKTEKIINDAELINDYLQDVKPLYTFKARISTNMYPDTILRNVRTHSYFEDGNNRFNTEFGLCATLEFLKNKLNWYDTIIIAGTPYIRQLVRGVYDIVEPFEQNIIEYCYENKVLFTNTLFRCELYSKYDSIPTSSHNIMLDKNYLWTK